MNLNRKNAIIVGVIALLIIISLVVAVIVFVQKAQQKEEDMAEVVEMMNFEKEQVQKEFTDMSVELEGYTSTIKNDSLFKLLENEKMKMNKLLEELKVTKSTNARRIAELKKELASLRKIMIHYVTQIDSLNSENKQLKTKNVEVQRKFQAASETVEQLSKEKQTLHEVVSRASMLEISNFSMQPLNSKGRKTSWFSQTANLKFNFTIAKNVTASVGDKIIYLRLTRPDDEVMTKSASNVFAFENRNIAYSASKKIEYTGEALSDAIYWKVEEILQKGSYRADFFIDGSRIGSFTFVVDK